MCFHSDQPKQSLPLPKQNAKKCALQTTSQRLDPGCQSQPSPPTISGGFTAFTAQSHRLGIPHTQASWPVDWPCALCTHSLRWPLCGQVSESQCGKRKFCCFTNESIPRLARQWINTTNDYSVSCPQNNDALEGMLPEMHLQGDNSGGYELEDTVPSRRRPERRLSVRESLVTVSRLGVFDRGFTQMLSYTCGRQENECWNKTYSNLSTL